MAFCAKCIGGHNPHLIKIGLKYLSIYQEIGEEFVAKHSGHESIFGKATAFMNG